MAHKHTRYCKHSRKHRGGRRHTRRTGGGCVKPTMIYGPKGLCAKCNNMVYNNYLHECPGPHYPQCTSLAGYGGRRRRRGTRRH